MLTPATFLIADHQNLFIEGLRRILQEKLPYARVVGAYTINELIACLDRHSPTTIFLNYCFIDTHFHLIRPLLAAKGYPEIVAVCEKQCNDSRKLSASIGAQSVIDKNVSVETIWNIIESRYDDTDNFQSHNSKHPLGISKTSALTSRQERILSLLVRGMTNREISETIGCAENTVKVHLNSAYKVLGVKNRTQAMCAISKIAQLGNIA